MFNIPLDGEGMFTHHLPVTRNYTRTGKNDENGMGWLCIH